MLAEDEEFDLARRFRDDNDLEAARRLGAFALCGW